MIDSFFKSNQSWTGSELYFFNSEKFHLVFLNTVTQARLILRPRVLPRRTVVYGEDRLRDDPLGKQAVTLLTRKEFVRKHSNVDISNFSSQIRVSNFQSISEICPSLKLTFQWSGRWCCSTSQRGRSGAKFTNLPSVKPTSFQSWTILQTRNFVFPFVKLSNFLDLIVKKKKKISGWLNWHLGQGDSKGQEVDEDLLFVRRADGRKWETDDRHHLEINYY